MGIVLNWNRSAETLACVESLLDSDWPNLTVIIVDNGSQPPIAQVLDGKLPVAVSIVRNETNRGFAGGMNAGISQALDLEADYVLLLNNDTRVDSTMITKLVQVAAEHPDVGMVSPLQFFRDAPNVVATAGLRADPRHAYQGKPLRMGERDIGQFRGVREVDAVVGTAMLVPTEVVRKVGLLDDDLYLYIEDVDWALRMRTAGHRIYVAYEARLWHSVSASTGGRHSPLVSYYHIRNTFVVCTRHAPMGKMRGVLRDTEILVANLLHAWRCRRPVAHTRAVLVGWRDYRRGRLGAAPAALARL